MTACSTLTPFSPGPLRGEITLPGDKSISHRALIAAAFFPQPTTIRGLNPGADVGATHDALLALGMRSRADRKTLRVEGGNLHSPEGVLDCLNSGSTARMLLGVCAGANLDATFDGDESLRRRPMEPVAAQLRAFGGNITTTDGRLPMHLRGGGTPQTRSFILLSASAQVKSALLFAALFARTGIEIRGGRGSRDHTERLLRYLGARIDVDARRIALLTPPDAPREIEVPGDFSAAAFFIVGATITPGSELCLRDVNVNPTRTGLLDALRAMSADIVLRNEREECGEPLADLFVRYAALQATSIDATTALRAIDEIPVLAVAAAFARGTTEILGVRDLRSKESDRLAAIGRLLRAVGITSEIQPNSIRIEGGTPLPAGIELLATEGDHRIAMAAAILAAAAGPLAIDDAECIKVSFPDFLSTLRSVQDA